MFLDSGLIENINVYETIKDLSHCSICTGILIDPQQCLSCDCCYCKKCITDWLAKSKSCPFKCENSNFKDSRLAKQMISRLNFKCPYGCSKTLTYDEILLHENHCENLSMECPTCSTFVSKSKIKISEYEKIIRSLKDEIEILKRKNIDIYDIPTMFNNRSKLFETPSGNFLRTITSNIALSENFSVSLKFLKLNHPGHMVIGVSDKVINENKGYLGGDLGKGNWGIAGNGAMGEEGVWTRTFGFKQGDVVTIKGKGSTISFQINGVSNGYNYDLKKKPLYFCISFYHEKELLELIIP